MNQYRYDIFLKHPNNILFGVANDGRSKKTKMKMKWKSLSNYGKACRHPSANCGLNSKQISIKCVLRVVACGSAGQRQFGMATPIMRSIPRLMTLTVNCCFPEVKPSRATAETCPLAPAPVLTQRRFWWLYCSPRTGGSVLNSRTGQASSRKGVGFPREEARFGVCGEK